MPTRMGYPPEKDDLAKENERLTASLQSREHDMREAILVIKSLRYQLTGLSVEESLNRSKKFLDEKMPIYGMK